MVEGTGIREAKVERRGMGKNIIGNERRNKNEKKNIGNKL